MNSCLNRQGLLRRTEELIEKFFRLLVARPRLVRNLSLIGFNELFFKIIYEHQFLKTFKWLYAHCLESTDPDIGVLLIYLQIFGKYYDETFVQRLLLYYSRDQVFRLLELALASVLRGDVSTFTLKNNDYFQGYVKGTRDFLHSYRQHQLANPELLARIDAFQRDFDSLACHGQYRSQGNYQASVHPEITQVAEATFAREPFARALAADLLQIRALEDLIADRRLPPLYRRSWRLLSASVGGVLFYGNLISYLNYSPQTKESKQDLEQDLRSLLALLRDPAQVASSDFLMRSVDSLRGKRFKLKDSTEELRLLPVLEGLYLEALRRLTPEEFVASARAREGKHGYCEPRPSSGSTLSSSSSGSSSTTTART